MSEMIRTEFESDVITECLTEGKSEETAREYLKRYGNGYWSLYAEGQWQGYLKAHKRYSDYRPMPSGVFQTTMHDNSVRVVFPVSLRKMWTGQEVQEWFNGMMPLYTQETLDKAVEEAFHRGTLRNYESNF